MIEVFPEQAHSRAELEEVKFALEAHGLYDNLSTFEKLVLTLQSARIKKMGGRLFYHTKGELQTVDLNQDQNEAG